MSIYPLMEKILVPLTIIIVVGAIIFLILNRKYGDEDSPYVVNEIPALTEGHKMLIEKSSVQNSDGRYKCVVIPLDLIKDEKLKEYHIVLPRGRRIVDRDSLSKKMQVRYCPTNMDTQFSQQLKNSILGDILAEKERNEQIIDKCVAHNKSNDELFAKLAVEGSGALAHGITVEQIVGIGEEIVKKRTEQKSNPFEKHRFGE